MLELYLHFGPTSVDWQIIFLFFIIFVFIYNKWELKSENKFNLLDELQDSLI